MIKITLIRGKVTLMFFLALAFIAFAGAQDFTFNNCGASGSTGPSSCSYSGDNSVSIIGNGIQQWTVPESGKYLITAVGPEAYSYSNSGAGAKIEGEFDLNSGTNLYIVVGQRGSFSNSYSSCDDTECNAGSGATFVAKEGTEYSTTWGPDVDPMLVAAGGSENIDAPADLVSSSSGGSAESSDAGGAGFDADGTDGNGGDGGAAFTHDPVGGSCGTWSGCTGGYGGGGGIGDYCGTGGSGGFQGGNGDETCGTSGTSLGKSYNDGSNQNNVAGFRESGHGYVEITACGTGNFNDPSLGSPSYTDSQASSSSPASFDTDVSVSVDSQAADDCGGTISGNSLSSCSVTATGEQGNSYSPSTSISGDTCEFSVDNDGVSAWGPGEEVTLDITVTDDEGGTDTLTDTYSFVDTDVDEVSVTSPSDNAGGVFGFDSGVDLEFSVTDYEAKNTNKDLSVDILGDSLQNIGTQTVSNGDGSVSIEWERDGEFGDTGMYGFKRGNSYDWNVDVVYASDGTDIGGNSGDPWTFTVENPPNINGLTPTDGAQSSGLSVQELQNTISVNQMEVEFYLGSLGTSSYNIEGTDTVLGSSGAASTNIMDSVQSGDEYEWFVGVDDGHSYIKYDSRVNTFTAPEVLRSATDLYVLPTERPSRDALNSLEAGDESYIWVDNGKLHWVDPATGTERWLQFAQSLSETTIPSGAIWVDGENLVWVGEDTTRYQHVGTNDGSSSLDPGTFWVDSSGYLRYVDGNGNERVMNG